MVATGDRVIEVLNPGALSTIQDLGRPGLAHLGIPRSGAADRRSLRLANRLVGNPDSAPAIEATLVGPRLRVWEAATLALTGADVPARRLGAGRAESELAMNVPVCAEAGDELAIGTARSALRTYIAVRGGLDVPRVLGSASTDLLTGLGPRPLRAGDRLAVGPAPQTPGPVDFAPDLHLTAANAGGGVRLGVVLGPRTDRFSPESVQTFLLSEFEVTPSSNRVGIRLRGPALVPAHEQELPSEGLVPGAIQVPPDGQPIILLADHPTTGGYPVIAVVRSDQLPAIGQLRPGERVGFVGVEAP